MKKNVQPHSTKKQLRIIAFGAHQDDCELNAAGVAAMWAARGHAVKFVNTTCGDTGHWRDGGGPLTRRRNAEVAAAARLLGITTETLDNHDGELMPTLENRKTFIRLIREWEADIVISPRPYDYHPDHRYTAMLVQDAAFMVIVPFVCPEVPILKRNPIFLFNGDRFLKPIPFKADIAVCTDPVFDKKLEALALLESQFLEGGCLGSEKLLPRNAQERKKRSKEVRDMLTNRFKALADKHRSSLVDWYGVQKGGKIETAEVFEICEYGRQPTREELKEIFPF